MAETQKCPVCGATYPDDESACPYIDQVPTVYNVNDLEFARWRVHNLVPGDSMMLQLARRTIARHDPGFASSSQNRVTRWLPHPIRVIAVLILVAGVYLAWTSRDFRLYWMVLTQLLFVPLSVGLWFYKDWARWLGIAYYSIGLIAFVTLQFPQVIAGNFRTLTFPGIALVILLYLWEWDVPDQNAH